MPMVSREPVNTDRPNGIMSDNDKNSRFYKLGPTIENSINLAINNQYHIDILSVILNDGNSINHRHIICGLLFTTPLKERGTVIMPLRKAEAVWNGGLLKGKGTIKFGSGAFTEAYSFSSRFESGKGTNPEELVGAASAGCFSMALAMMLEQAGFPPETIHTVAQVSIDKIGDGFSITTIALDTEAKVPGIDDKIFQEKALAAKTGCPVSRALSGATITLHAKLM
jgi:lipoyl-dependent peroxiredoxin